MKSIKKQILLHQYITFRFITIIIHESRKKENDSTTIRRSSIYTYYSAKINISPYFIYNMFTYYLEHIYINDHQMKIVRKIFIFQKHLQIWIWGTTIYFALLGGYKINQF